jgi:cold-inducible RNA-binding protein
MKNLYVGNFPHSTTEPQLRTLFEAHGKVERVNIITDKETGRPKGFAFVEMTEAGDADKACLALTGQRIGRSRATGQRSQGQIVLGLRNVDRSFFTSK